MTSRVFYRQKKNGAKKQRTTNNIQHQVPYISTNPNEKKQLFVFHPNLSRSHPNLSRSHPKRQQSSTAHAFLTLSDTPLFATAVASPDRNECNP
ncbi:hypothetical protein DPMN_174866 [Dreissena polymorpha]|uniref:Uncharacterized protein n=1 Tax=Dreissena polymorpha TaxID=45954 RepID=A0A9D4E7Z0_DREPO|nr:hypothetical protein DPMN_174866 [Dreissena polymorpha]